MILSYYLLVSRDVSKWVGKGVTADSWGGKKRKLIYFPSSNESNEDRYLEEHMELLLLIALK